MIPSYRLAIVGVSKLAFWSYRHRREMKPGMCKWISKMTVFDRCRLSGHDFKLPDDSVKILDDGFAKFRRFLGGWKMIFFTHMILPSQR